MTPLKDYQQFTGHAVNCGGRGEGGGNWGSRKKDLGVIYTEKEVKSIHEYSGKRTQNKMSGKPDILEAEKNVLRWGGLGWGVGD